MSEEFLWVEKYRPRTVSDCILPTNLLDIFTKIVETGDLPNMMFTGTAGLGKTTVARALCEQLGVDYIVINGSEEGNIDTLRGKIKQFASSVSLQGKYKVVILDEADYLNPQSTQPALRGFIEEFSKNCRFILTCNFKNRIIEPLHSRCGVYEFNTTKKDLAQLCGKFMIRSVEILKENNVPFEKQSVIDIISKHAPDWRRVLNELQRQFLSGSVTGTTTGSLDNLYLELFDIIQQKNFKRMRSWVVNNIDIDSSAIFRGLYDNMYSKVEPHSIPQLVLILADYQYKNAFVADHELNIVACLTEIMANVKFK
tara:strand:+ start:927 stop:1862 length:936 start_codon:yes stop_codon:yes gene_type:complete